MNEFKRNIFKTVAEDIVIVTDPLLLGYATTSGPDACADEVTSPLTRYVPVGDLFLVATVLYQNAAGTIPAQAGYYSDGAKWRYWNEVSFTTEDFCS